MIRLGLDRPPEERGGFIELARFRFHHRQRVPRPGEAGVDFESPVREPIAPFGTKPERDEDTRARGERPAA